MHIIIQITIMIITITIIIIWDVISYFVPLLQTLQQLSYRERKSRIVV